MQARFHANTPLSNYPVRSPSGLCGRGSGHRLGNFYSRGTFMRLPEQPTYHFETLEPVRGITAIVRDDTEKKEIEKFGFRSWSSGKVCFTS